MKGWTRWSFKVPSNLICPMVLWFYESVISVTKSVIVFLCSTVILLAFGSKQSWTLSALSLWCFYQLEGKVNVPLLLKQILYYCGESFYIVKKEVYKSTLIQKKCITIMISHWKLIVTWDKHASFAWEFKSI